MVDLSKLNGLKLLCIADTHRTLNPFELDILEKYRDSVDLVLTLGDIPVESMKRIDCDYGVLGNHDYFNGIEKENDLHMRIIENNGILFGGFQGSSRYKSGPFVLYDHEESCKLLDKLDYCDIFISHDSCIKDYFKEYGGIDAHSGLLGIDKYIKKNKPLLHIHGHHHKNVVEYKYDIPSICVYKMVLISVENGELSVVVLDG